MTNAIDNKLHSRTAALPSIKSARAQLPGGQLALAPHLSANGRLLEGQGRNDCSQRQKITTSGQFWWIPSAKVERILDIGGNYPSIVNITMRQRGSQVRPHRVCRSLVRRKRRQRIAPCQWLGRSGRNGAWFPLRRPAAMRLPGRAC